MLSSTVGLTSCLWLLIDRASISSAEADHILDTEPAEFYAQAAMMGGGAAMTVILSLTSAADLIHDNTVNIFVSQLSAVNDFFNHQKNKYCSDQKNDNTVWLLTNVLINWSNLNLIYKQITTLPVLSINDTTELPLQNRQG